MELTKDSKISEVVANDYRTAKVFKNHSIDFCCQGNRSLTSACEDKNIAVEQILDELKTILNDSTDDTSGFNSWQLDELAEYIEKKHHRYCEEKITEIKPYLEKITQVHGQSHPELYEISAIFSETAGQMSAHMKKEELLIFPFIKRLVKLKEEGGKLPKARFNSDQNPIDLMLKDHNDEGERFRKIRELSKNYEIPEDACSTYRVSLALLHEFEEDLHEHIHLENNILFPKSIALEKELV